MRLGLLAGAVKVPQPPSVRVRLVHVEELEVLVTVDLEDVVLVAGLDADDVASLDVGLLAAVQDLRPSTADEIQLVVLVIVAVVLSASLAMRK